MLFQVGPWFIHKDLLSANSRPQMASSALTSVICLMTSSIWQLLVYPTSLCFLLKSATINTFMCFWPASLCSPSPAENQISIICLHFKLMHYSVTVAQIWEMLSSTLALNIEKELQRVEAQSRQRKVCCSLTNWISHQCDGSVYKSFRQGKHYATAELWLVVCVWHVWNSGKSRSHKTTTCIFNHNDRGQTLWTELVFRRLVLLY